MKYNRKRSDHRSAALETFTTLQRRQPLKERRERNVLRNHETSQFPIYVSDPPTNPKSKQHRRRVYHSASVVASEPRRSQTINQHRQPSEPFAIWHHRVKRNRTVTRPLFQKTKEPRGGREGKFPPSHSVRRQPLNPMPLSIGISSDSSHWIIPIPAIGTRSDHRRSKRLPRARRQ